MSEEKQKIDEYIKKLEDVTNLIEETNNKFYHLGFYDCKVSYEFEKRVRCTLALLRTLKEKGVDPFQTFTVSDLIFSFNIRTSTIEFEVSYKKELNAEIYDTYSGSWSTQYCELKKWFEDTIVDEGYGFPLTPGQLDFDYNINNEKRLIEQLAENIEKTIKFMNNPSERFVYCINNHLDLIKQKIKWWKEDENNGLY